MLLTILSEVGGVGAELLLDGAEASFGEVGADDGGTSDVSLATASM